MVSQETAAIERFESEQLIGIERGRTKKIEEGESEAWHVNNQNDVVLDIKKSLIYNKGKKCKVV